jgi:hypothetical protein
MKCDLYGFTEKDGWSLYGQMAFLHSGSNLAGLLHKSSSPHWVLQMLYIGRTISVCPYIRLVQLPEAIHDLIQMR